jgi:hypothetical protein
VRLTEAIHKMHVPTRPHGKHGDKEHGETARRAHDSADNAHGEQPTVLGGNHLSMHMHKGADGAHGGAGHDKGGGHGGGGGKFLVGDDPLTPGGILGLNLALWWFLSTPKT